MAFTIYSNVTAIIKILAVLVSLAPVRGQFIQQPSSVANVEGSTVLLNCVIDKTWKPDAGFTFAVWFKDRIMVAISNSSDRYKFLDSNRDINGNYTLQITRLNVMEDDAEFYCEWRNTNSLPDKSSKIATLTVLVPPKRVTLSVGGVFVGKDHPVSVKAGSETNMTCTSESSHPRAEILWFIDGRNITSFAKQVEVTGERANTSTTFSCLNYTFTAKHNKNQLICRTFVHLNLPPTESSVTVSVLYLSDIVTVRPGGRQLVIKGEDVVLHCEANGNPVPVITWYHLPSTTGAYLHSNGTSLLLTNVRTVHEGKYWCKAENTLASFNSSIVEIEISTLSHAQTNVAAVVGPVAAVLVLVGLVVIIVCAYRWRRCCFTETPAAEGDQIERPRTQSSVSALYAQVCKRKPFNFRFAKGRSDSPSVLYATPQKRVLQHNSGNTDYSSGLYAHENVAPSIDYEQRFVYSQPYDSYDLNEADRAIYTGPGNRWRTQQQPRPHGEDDVTYARPVDSLLTEEDESYASIK